MKRVTSDIIYVKCAQYIAVNALNLYLEMLFYLFHNACVCPFQKINKYFKGVLFVLLKSEEDLVRVQQRADG